METLERTEAWQLWLTEPQAVFPDGARLSTDCVCRRLRELRAPDEYRDFPEHLDARGHGFEQIVLSTLRREGHMCLEQITVPWNHGESHLDVFVAEGPRVKRMGRPIMYEIKANADAKLRPENARQVRRQRRAVERAAQDGLELRVQTVDGWMTMAPQALLEAEWRILVIDPLSWRVPLAEGYEVSYNDEHRELIDAEHDLMDRYMPILDKLDPYTESDWPECACGKCWPAPVSELPAEMRDDAFAYRQLAEEAKELDAQQEEIKLRVWENLARRALYLGIPVWRRDVANKGPSGVKWASMQDGLPWMEARSWEGAGEKITITKPHAQSGMPSLRFTEQKAKTPLEQL